MRILKKKIILAALEAKKRREAFNLEDSESYQLPPDAGINMNNSHFFTASNNAGESLSMRLGMRNGSEYEIFVLYKSSDGRFFVHEKDSYPVGECPVRFECVSAGHCWRISFGGRLRDTSTSELIESTIEVEFTDEYPIYDFVYHVDRFNGMAQSIAREKWSRSFFKELSESNQRHYEQAGRICGKVDIGQESFAVDLCCVRDHSFGCREWDRMNEHIWFLGITGDDRVLSFSIVNYPRLKRIFSGYTNIFADRYESLRDYEILSYDSNGGNGPDQMTLRCYFPEGKKLDVKVSRVDNVKCSFGGGCYAFQEGLADFEINGVKGRGTIEYGFNADSSRWEGYSKLR